ncbi:MAG: ferritin [Candidatus Latescibacteria bacterium]|nr:ferritin [bacterium]MBD3424732.1 ferritin [Candidatus Latescibacterota bacterium]
MINEKVNKAFNEQIQKEMYSAYLYLSMATQFYADGLEGISQWLRSQALEELTHAMKFFDHITERDGRVELEAIEKPPSEWDSPVSAFKDALKHEEYITGEINNLVDLTEKEKDYASKTLLQWFVDEQVEEEGSVSKVLQELEMVKESPHGLLMVDKELGGRTIAAEQEEEE